MRRRLFVANLPSRCKSGLGVGPRSTPRCSSTCNSRFSPASPFCLAPLARRPPYWTASPKQEPGPDASPSLAFRCSARKAVDLPPRDRHVGYLFQTLALFPHMTVRQSISTGCARESIRAPCSVSEIAESFGIAGLFDRRQGYQGERQQVRGTGTERDRALLLDEPLTALDAVTKGASSTICAGGTIVMPFRSSMSLTSAGNCMRWEHVMVLDAGS